MKKKILKYLKPQASVNCPEAKVFGIGNNKTGTTSLKEAMAMLGYSIGDQRQAELLHKEWAIRNFSPIVEYCKTANFFQDFPFSKPFTFIALDQAFPNSKFILTVRDDPEQWYNSLLKFQAKLWGKNGKPPTVDQLKKAEYVYKGWAWEVKQLAGITPENQPYDKTSLIKSYNDYNACVLDYFKHRPKDLLVLNVSEKGAFKLLCQFLEKAPVQEDFPWENKT
jgi:hypothetical protein